MMFSKHFLASFGGCSAKESPCGLILCIRNIVEDYIHVKFKNQE